MPDEGSLEELRRKVEGLERRLGRASADERLQNIVRAAPTVAEARKSVLQPVEKAGVGELADRITRVAGTNGILVEWTARDLSAGAEAAAICCCCCCGCHCYA